MLIWRRDIPKNFRSLVAIGTLSAMVALAPVMQYSTTLGQEPRPPKEQTKEQTKEQKPPPVKGSEEKGPVKKSDETGQVKGSKEKEPIKKSEEQQQKEGRGEKTEKAPVKKDEKAPVKGDEKVPIRGEKKTPVKGNERVPVKGDKKALMKSEEKGTDAAANAKDSMLEGQLVKITGNMLMMTSKGGKEYSLRLMEDVRLTLEEKVFRTADLKPGMIIRVTTLPPDHSRATRIEVLDLNAGPAANTRLPKEGTPIKEMPKEGENIPPPSDVKLGTLQYDTQSSTTCGPGKICFNYRLPTKVSPLGNQTGIGVISLAIYQNGMQVMTQGTPGMPLILTSGKLTSGSSYCFQITLAILSDLNPSLGGFDFVGTGQYSMAGTTVNNATVGMAPDGRIPDRNNDYKIFCGEGPGGGEDPGHPVAQECCLGKNLVQNGDFESNGAINSQYQQAGSMAALKPGTYIRYKVDYIKEACSNWQLPEACKGTKDFTGNVLFVNGLTNQIPPAFIQNTIWQQKIPISDKKEKYRVCFRYLPLPQCCFNVVAKPTILVMQALPLPLTDVQDEDTGCGHLVSATFEAVGSSVNLSIILPQQNAMGDGNDLMIDNISVAKLESVASALVDFKVEGGTAVNSCDVALLPGGPLPSPSIWEFELWTVAPGLPNGIPVAGTIVSGAATHTYTGLTASVNYFVTLKVKSPCHKLTGKYLGWSFGPLVTQRKASEKPMDIPDAEPAKTEKGPETPKGRD